MNLPIILYGAGGRAAYGKQCAEMYGLNPTCFVDIDEDKQGKTYLGLPILSLEKARDTYNDFYVYLTPGQELHREIFDYLLENRIAENRILNYTETEECTGCAKFDDLVVFSSGLTFCCSDNDEYSDPSMVSWKDNDWNMETAINKYLSMKDRYTCAVKNGEKCTCTGCIEIKKEHRQLRKTIRTLTLGLNHPCQLSCVYCCTKIARGVKNYHGTDDSNSFVKHFDYKGFLEALEKKGLIAYDTLIVFVGGEITINPRIDEILDSVEKHRVYLSTNGLIYNERIARLSSRRGNSICISVDSGTKNTFHQVKGADSFDIVWSNIKKYTQYGANVILKYIFLEENSNMLDVNGFITEALKANVKTILLSVDANRPTSLADEQLCVAAKMLNLAEKNNLQWDVISMFNTEEREAIFRFKSLMT